MIWKLGDLIEKHLEEFAQLESLDNGKPLTIARVADVPLTADHFRYMAGWATKIEGNTIPISAGGGTTQFLAYTVREPVGVVGQIIPWNFPLLMAAWKLGPALASGCTVVLKPAEQTPLSALLLGELIQEAGIPDGSLIAAILMVQFVGVPFSFAFGALARRIGAKRAIFLALAVYMVITLVAFTIRTTGQFFLLAFLVGTVMGGAQALSRSLFSTMIPRHKSAEMFGFFGVFDRFGGALGSSVFGVVLVVTGSSRPAILILILFFAAGALLLSRVDVARGQRAAREAEARAA